MTKYLISMISAMVLGCLTLGLAQTEAESSNSLTVEAQLCTAIEDSIPVVPRYRCSWGNDYQARLVL
jgi:hypothetical protein